MSAVTNVKPIPVATSNAEPAAKKQIATAQKAKQVVDPLLVQWVMNDGRIKRNLPVNPPIWRRNVK